MARGTNFLNNSKYPCCKKQDRVSRPYGHMSESRNLFLEGFCPKCNETKSLPYTKQQLDMEGEGIKNFFKNVYNKVLKPIGKEVGKNNLANPGRALQVGSQFGASLASKIPQAILSSAAQAGRFGVLGQGVKTKGGAVKTGELTNGTGLYLLKK